VPVGVGFAGLGGELDVDGLLGAAFFLFGEVDEGTPVALGERRLQEASGPELSGGYDVESAAYKVSRAPRYNQNSRPRTIANTPYTWLV